MRQEIWLGARQADGATLRQHLETVGRMSGKVPDELIPTPIDACVSELWGLWCELRASAGSSGYGPAAITRGDAREWSHTHGVPLTGWEVETVIAMDAAARAAIAEQQSRQG